MKIKVEKLIIDKENEEYSYHIVDINKCCDKLINSSIIVFGTNSGDAYSASMYQELECDFGYDYINEEIQYCPFCGKKIEIEIVNTIDKEDDYNRLYDSIKDLLRKRNSCDSIRKRDEIQQEICSINQKIQEMIINDSIEDFLDG